MGAAPALAKDIAGAEPAGEAEKAATTRPVLGWATLPVLEREAVDLSCDV